LFCSLFGKKIKDNKCWVILLDLNVFEEKYEKLKAEFSDALDILTEMLGFNIAEKCLLKVFEGNITFILGVENLVKIFQESAMEPFSSITHNYEWKIEHKICLTNFYENYLNSKVKNYVGTISVPGLVEQVAEIMYSQLAAKHFCNSIPELHKLCQNLDKLLNADEPPSRRTIGLKTLRAMLLTNARVVRDGLEENIIYKTELISHPVPKQPVVTCHSEIH
jgi:hypothetical protein